MTRLITNIGGITAPVLHALFPEAAYPDLLRGLVGAWIPALGNQGSRLIDVSGRSNHGTLTDMDPASDWVASEKGLVIDLDSTNDDINLGAVGLLRSQSQFTVVSWFRQANAATFYRAILSHAQSGDGTNRALIYQTLVASGDSALFFGSGVGYGYTATGIFTANEWHCGGWTFNGAGAANADRAKIYKNGTELSLSFSGTIPATTHLQNYAHTIGAEHATAPSFNGQIAGVLLWHRPLSVNEHRQLYEIGPTGLFQRRTRKYVLIESAASGDGVGAADGHATASGTGASSAGASGSADGHATAIGTGTSSADAAGSADGHATASGTGTSSADAAGAADGHATAEAVGSVDGSAGSADGHATATATGAALADAAGSADGHATAEAVGGEVGSDASADGHSTASGVGAALAGAAGSADGHATASLLGAAVAAAIAAADGHAAASGVGAGAAPDVPGIEFTATLDRLHYTATLDRLHYRLTEHECLDSLTGDPIAVFTGTPLTGYQPLTVTFTDSSTGTPTVWSWDFGDGNTSTTQNPSNEYVDIGDYTVALTVSNDDGMSKTTRHAYVTVAPWWDLRVDGDSIVTGTSEGDPPYPFPDSWADLLYDLYDADDEAPVVFANVAEGGTFLSHMTTDPRKQATLDAIDVSAGDERLMVYVCQMGNGLIEYQPHEYYTHLKAFVADLRAQAPAYVAVIPACIWHRDNDVYAPGWDTGISVNAINELLLNDPSLWDGIIDWTQDSDYTSSPHYSSLAAAADTDLFPDGIHQSDVVNEPASEYAKSIIDKRLGPNWSKCTVAPVLTGDQHGDLHVGESVSCSTGTWDSSGAKLYQWFYRGHDWVADEAGHDFPIPGATSSSYVIECEYADHALKCNVGNTINGVTSWTASAHSDPVESYLAPSLLTNGRFGGLFGAGWSAEAGALYTTTGNRMVLTQPTPGQNHIRIVSDTLTLEVGEQYRLAVSFTEGTGGDSRIRVRNTSDLTQSQVIIELAGGSGDYTQNFTATEASVQIEVRDPGNAGDAKTWYFDNFDLSKIVTDEWEQFADESFATGTYSTTTGTSVTSDDLAGPIAGFLADEITIASDGYHYKPLGSNNAWTSGDGDTLRVLYAVKGVAGEKVALRFANTGSNTDYLHTFTGEWEIIDLANTMGAGYVNAIVGFDRRNSVVAGSDSGSPVTFHCWGIAWRMS